MRLPRARVHSAIKTMKMLGCDRSTLVVSEPIDDALGLPVFVAPWMGPDEWRLVQPETLDAIKQFDPEDSE